MTCKLTSCYILLKIISLQTGFHTVGHSILRVLVMMIGELDFGNIFIDTIHVNNDKTQHPLNPFPSVAFVFLFFCLFLLTIALMNLLVRKYSSSPIS